jgi:hypothetical protein
MLLTKAFFAKEVAFSQMKDYVLPSSLFRYDGFGGITALVVVLFVGTICVEGKDIVKKVEPAGNPHGDPASCSFCHTSAFGGQDNLLFGGNISILCNSCHDGHLAMREVHPVDVKPSETLAKKIPPDMPLANGMLTCLSCHDVSGGCKTEQSAAEPVSLSKHHFLRGTQSFPSLGFCYRCHDQENYQSFNVHDQLENGNAKTDTCLWCHINVPDVKTRLKEGDSYALRNNSVGICYNCHVVTKGHPTGVFHMKATPTEEMLWYISAYEIEPGMRLPFMELLEYVRAAKRTPRSIPLDENGCITCYSCHNPHEEGLLPKGNPRSIGAESNHATNHRLRGRESKACRTCHEK